jgi:hypothetical protein
MPVSAGDALAAGLPQAQGAGIGRREQMARCQEADGGVGAQAALRCEISKMIATSF